MSETFNLIIDKDVITGMLDHAYTDPVNEVVGSLGGYIDEKLQVVHATKFMASRRVTTELAPDSVEGLPEDQHSASEKFNNIGLKYVGWYHSHPRIQPVPSERDLAMQLDLQTQVPYCIGVICSPYMGVKQMAQTFYLSAFRVIKVAGRNQNVPIEFYINDKFTGCPKDLVETSKIAIQEAQDIRTDRLASGQFSEAFLDYAYIDFLGAIYNSSLIPASTALQQDVRDLQKTASVLEHDIALKLEWLRKQGTDPEILNQLIKSRLASPPDPKLAIIERILEPDE